MKDALDCWWLSFALNEGFAASKGEGLPEAKQNKTNGIFNSTLTDISSHAQA